MSILCLLLFSGRSVDHETLASLIDTIHALLIKIYPTKEVGHFEIQRKAATVAFVGCRLNVDIVPVIEDPDMRIMDGSSTSTMAL